MIGEWHITSLYHSPCGVAALSPDDEHYECPKCKATFDWGPDPCVPEDPDNDD